MSLVVNLFGAPSSGKSKMAYGISYHLKQNNIRCEFTGEVAKDFVWEDRHLKNQKYIFAKQENRIFRLNGKVDVIVSDSPLLLPFIYAEKSYPQSYFDFVEYCWNSYNNFNFLIEPQSGFDPVGRIHGAEESTQIHEEIKNLLNEKDIPYFKIKDTETSLLAVVELIKYALRGGNIL